MKKKPTALSLTQHYFDNLPPHVLEGRRGPGAISGFLHELAYDFERLGREQVPDDSPEAVQRTSALAAFAALKECRDGGKANSALILRLFINCFVDLSRNANLQNPTDGAERS